MARIIVRKNSKRIATVAEFNDGRATDDSVESIHDDSSTGIIVDQTARESDSVVDNTTGIDNIVSSSVNGNSPNFIDPTSATGGTGDGTPKRRGRKPGTKNRVNRATQTQTTADLGTLLFSLHLGMASILKMPNMILAEDEAERLGAAITRVTELYEVSVLPEKAMAWINLTIVVGSVYGPRVMIGNGKKEKPKVIQMPNFVAGPIGESVTV